MKRILSLSIIILLTARTFAQPVSNGKISVTLLNDKNSSMEHASALLLKAADSSLCKTALSDKNGLIEFDHLPAGDYLLKVSSAGYEEKYSGKLTLSSSQPSATIKGLSLQSKKTTNLKEVTVTGRKP